MRTTKYITLNVGLNNLPPNTQAKHIMDSIAYTFDTRTFALAEGLGTCQGEPEPTYIIVFPTDNVADSTILARLERLADVYAQDGIAYRVSTGQTYTAAGIAWSPGVSPEEKYLFDNDLFLNIAVHDKQDLYISENTPPGSTKYKG